MLKIEQPGMPCPECKTFIPMTLEDLVRAKPFPCPNPSCYVVLNLQVAESIQSLDAIRELKTAIDQSQKAEKKRRSLGS
ncbi:MAG: hypothetical protein KF784_14065 [Fimbriimonadaceae bacterium]|nr:hypothetical protein [Fimbriimonadaceae bacterium]